ncbi:hypothetical protein ACH5RR_022691 [Cinchona calisaya]|uniref:Uncharacterized protein n=1 Tax=Cinchona calisaya TaxID=153742 RepID=A0ABD2Z8J9_9GENT
MNFQDIGRLSKLEHLLLHINQLNGTLPSSLKNCTRLITLNLRVNLLGSELSTFDFSKFSQLQIVDLGNNFFNGSFPATLASCRALTAIRLSTNRLTGEIHPAIQSLKSLSFLSLSNNSLSNIARTMKFLSSCKNLRTLLLSKNFCNEYLPYDESLVGPDGFENLQLLALGGCNFSGFLPIEITTLERLVASDKSANQVDLWYLELPVLVEPDNISALQYNRLSNLPPTIDLNDNNFQGTIPEKIGQLNFLHVLDLRKNYFSGNIPDTVAELSNLEKLDLSFNSFSGEIPVSFKKLHFLSSFSVANNNLQGLIPSGGQFDTFPATSFEGNSGLCGSILQRSCPDHQSTNSEPPSKSTSPETFWFVFWICFGASFSVTFVTYGILLKRCPIKCYYRIRSTFFKL